MKKEQVIKKIKVLLGMVKAEFETAKLADGSEVSFDSLEINREVYDSEGNALKAGEIVLEDGTKIEVDENGVIKEIERPDGEETKEEIVTEEMACGEKKEELAEETEETEETTEETKEETTETTETSEAKDTEETKEETKEEPEYVSKSDFDELAKSVSDLYEMVLTIAEKVAANEEAVNETKAEFSKLANSDSTEPVHYQNNLSSKLDRINQMKSFLKK